MDSLKIKDYSKQLEQICEVCRRSAKCKDKTKLCLAKQLVFQIGKTKYKRNLKKESKK